MRNMRLSVLSVKRSVSCSAVSRHNKGWPTLWSKSVYRLSKIKGDYSVVRWLNSLKSKKFNLVSVSGQFVKRCTCLIFTTTTFDLRQFNCLKMSPEH